MMRRWQLPEYVEDVLPDQAHALERWRRQFLDLLFSHGYELVMPPLVEFSTSLLIGKNGLDLYTCKLVDRLSSQTLGVRADMTPQVTRIDAHLLNRRGVVRLCYFASVVHSVPMSLTSTREPIQFGAELYGHQGLEADKEVVDLLAQILLLCPLRHVQVEFGHVGIFHALAQWGQWSEDLEQEIHEALQSKDEPRLRESSRSLSPELSRALIVLMKSQGGVEVVRAARLALPDLPSLRQPLNDLEAMHHTINDVEISYDLAELGSFGYHTGLVFAAYAEGFNQAVARGGRYDNVGEVFGRARAATGFSLDVRGIMTQETQLPLGILAPWPSTPSARELIVALRAKGERVAEALPGHEGTWREAGFDRKIVEKNGCWVVDSLEE